MWREKMMLLIGQNPYFWFCKHLGPVLSILSLEDSKDMLVLSLEGSSWHCLLARQCLSPLSFDLSQPPQAYVSAGKHCIPSRRHGLLVPFSPLPKQPDRVCASCLSYPACVKVVLLGKEIRISPCFLQFFTLVKCSDQGQEVFSFEKPFV